MHTVKILGFLIVMCLIAACSPTASPTATAAPTVAATPTRASMMGELVVTTNPDATAEPGELIEETLSIIFTALFRGEDVTPYVCKEIGEKAWLIEAYAPRTEDEKAETVNLDQMEIGMSINPQGIYNVNAVGPVILTANGTDREINVDMGDTPMIFEDDTWKICG